MAFFLNVRCPARLSVLAQRRALDHQLAAGIDPRTDPALGLRAAHLCRRRYRRAIARRLRRTIAAARTAPNDRMGFAALARSAILEEADALMDLVHRLEDERPVEAMGVALAKQLVSDDANSPLAADAEPGTLHIVIRLATVALDLSPRHAARADEP